MLVKGLEGNMEPGELQKKLEVLAHLESSGGKNKLHAPQTSGIHKGTRAVSSYGLMPNTVKEFTLRNKEFQKTPTGQLILQNIDNPEAINKITEQQEHDDAIMSALLNEQRNRISKYADESDDPELLNVFAHRRGVSGAIKAAKDDSYYEDPYVKAYQEEKARRFPQLQSFLKK